jgi:hypothetical protein
MENVLGKRMIDEGLVTEEQLEKALDRQKNAPAKAGAERPPRRRRGGGREADLDTTNRPEGAAQADQP